MLATKGKIPYTKYQILLEQKVRKEETFYELPKRAGYAAGKAGKGGEVPRLLLHSCCAPCSSYVLEYLSDYFEITVFYYNPNIFPESEYTKRILEQQTLIGEMQVKYPISFLAGHYDREKFYKMAEGLEHLKEGGERCLKCYELRLRESAQIAKKGGFDYFTTTLTISPLKMQTGLMKSARKWKKNMALRIFSLISRRKMVIKDP